MLSWEAIAAMIKMGILTNGILGEFNTFQSTPAIFLWQDMLIHAGNLVELIKVASG